MSCREREKTIAGSVIGIRGWATKPNCHFLMHKNAFFRLRVQRMDKGDRDMAKKDYHVVPHDGNWAVRKEGASKVSSQHSTQAAAIAAGQKLAKNHATELVIHARDGRIRDSDS